MKTVYKVFAILMIAVSMFVIMPDNMSFAADDAGSTAITAINKVKDNTSSDKASAAADGLAGVVGKLLGFLQIASGIIATPEVKDEMKKKMLPIIIGIVLVFGATSVAKFLIGVVG